MSNINPERFLESDKQVITIKNEYHDKVILDIGGGGEGIIGKIYGKNVIAIDKSIDELEETNNKAVKIVMNASDLKFTSMQFDVTTSFFTFMYMSDESLEKTISEIHRVLKEDGILEIWDTWLPKYEGGKQDIYIAKLKVLIDYEEINTGYGRLMDKKGREKEDYLNILKDKGFMIIDEEDINNEMFRIKCIKK